MSTNMFYNATPNSFEKARWLRKRLTRHEKILWSRLRKKQICGIAIRRQHPIGCYIADFYCHYAKLIVEIDGVTHDHPNQAVYDEERTLNLNHLGLMVLRFTNEDIENRLEFVIMRITQCINDRIGRV